MDEWRAKGSTSTAAGVFTFDASRSLHAGDHGLHRRGHAHRHQFQTRVVAREHAKQLVGKAMADFADAGEVHLGAAEAAQARGHALGLRARFQPHLGRGEQLHVRQPRQLHVCCVLGAAGHLGNALEPGLLLIDEADRADPGKAMCLQGILEGKPYYMKKTGEIVHAASGFNVIVTANTKGRGSDDGRYVAATMLDDAWLERFPITIEQEYPTAAIEKKILTNYLSDDTITDDDKAMIDHLTVWSEIIRKTFTEGAIDELISTRRLVQIGRAHV